MCHNAWLNISLRLQLLSNLEEVIVVQVVQYAMALIVSWAYTVPGVREALYAEEGFHTWLRRLVLEEPEPCVRREVCTALYR